MHPPAISEFRKLKFADTQTSVNRRLARRYVYVILYFMNKEIQYLIQLYQTAYDGDPWYGKSIKSILSEIDKDTAVKKVNDQHSILELLYHMINWREFTISRLDEGKNTTADFFGENDWQILDHKDLTLWERGLKLLDATQTILIETLKKLNPEILDKIVAERKYDGRHLLYGLLEHDVYHLGQIAFIQKSVRA